MPYLKLNESLRGHDEIMIFMTNQTSLHILICDEAVSHKAMLSATYLWLDSWGMCSCLADFYNFSLYLINIQTVMEQVSQQTDETRTESWRCMDEQHINDGSQLI